MIGVQVYRPVVVLNGKVIITFVAISNTTITIGIGKIRVQVYRPVVVLNGKIIIAFEAVSSTTIVIGIGKSGFRSIAQL